MKKHYTVLILVTLLITLSACARPDVDKNDVVPEQPVEAETTEEQVYIEDSIRFHRRSAGRFHTGCRKFIGSRSRRGDKGRDRMGGDR